MEKITSVVTMAAVKFVAVFLLTVYINCEKLARVWEPGVRVCLLIRANVSYGLAK